MNATTAGHGVLAASRARIITSYRNLASSRNQTRSFVTTVSCCGSGEGSGHHDDLGHVKTGPFNLVHKNNGIVKGIGLYGTSLQKRKPVCQGSSAGAAVWTVGDDAFGCASGVAEEKVGVLLLNLGGPETLHDVQPFLFNLFADPDIIRLPRLFRFLQRPLAQLISVLRAPKSKEGYASIGGGSPLRKITDEQANALKIALKARRAPANVYVGMRYWYPFTEEAVEQIKKDRITRLVILPLYPQYSISTSGSSIRLLQNIFRKDSYLSRLPVSIIRSWYQREGYIKSMASLIEEELQKFSVPEQVMIFFSAHGVPVSYVEDAGDPYKDQMEECISLIMQELKARGINNDHTLAYQSFLRIKCFVSEHIETLEEIDMEYKHLALESGIENWGRVPALGCTTSFISDLADAVIEALPSATAISSEKCTSTEADSDPFRYVVKLLFGSILAFFLLLFPRFISTLKNYL
ncbi:hypothetical protein Sjap_019466 [Stephania japonica]|uniref:Ferrochelatase n=1 Tax=Stephania japonica TaxID=461633 RepID=A0AAP0F4B4_9MAGN